jgi:predicted porin
MAVAVAGALAAPGVALAQASSLTISGFFKAGFDSLWYSNSAATRLNKSETRVLDGSSRILFNATEDLGGGLSAIAQLDQRFTPDQASTIQTSNPVGGGNTWVGLRSTTFGTLTMGRSDLHYGKSPDDTTSKAGAYQASANAVFDFVTSGTGVNTAIANTTRTQNVVKYDSPNFSGFTATVAWSANPLGNSEQDMLNTTAAVGQQSITPGPIPGAAAIGAPLTAATVPGGGGGPKHKGDGWNVNPQYTNGPFQVGYSYWRAKQDAPVAATTDQRGDSVYGYYRFGGFKVGLGWNKSKLERANDGAQNAERTAWSLPMSYVWGPHNIVGHYTRAGDISSDLAGATTNGTGARMVAVAYVYDLSKRTSVGLTYAKINNDSNAAYNLYNSSSAASGSLDDTIVNGESPRMLQATVKHAF